MQSQIMQSHAIPSKVEAHIKLPVNINIGNVENVDGTVFYATVTSADNKAVHFITERYSHEKNALRIAQTWVRQKLAQQKRQQQAQEKRQEKRQQK